MKKKLENAEKAFVILSLILFSINFSLGSSSTTPPIIPPSILTALRYLVWATSVTFVCVQWKLALVTARRDIFIWLLIPIISTSYIWSESPESTLSNMREVWQMTSFALYFAMRFTLKDQVKLVAWTFAIGSVLSILFALIIPDIGIHRLDHPGAWKGIYDYKNTFGSMMVLSSLASFLLPIDKPIHRLYKWAGFGLSLILMLLSTSKTSLVLSILLVLILSFYRNFRWRGKVSVIFLDVGILVLGCVSLVVFGEWVTILSGLGKDPTLTGRTLIWGVVFTQLQERPWLGFGRNAFWAGGSKYALAAGKAVADNFIPPHAHNGFIDLALDVGLLGFSIFLISFSIAYFRALKQAYAAKNSEEIWPLAVLMFLAMNNITESYLLRLSNIYWVLYITIALSVNKRKRI